MLAPTKETRTERWRRQLLGESNGVSASHWKNLLDQFPQPPEESDDDDKKKDSVVSNTPAADEDKASDANLDPLSAIVAESLEEKEREANVEAEFRKQTMRNRGGSRLPDNYVESEDYDETLVAFQIIQRDLIRLPPSHRMRIGKEDRVKLLQSVLWVYTSVQTQQHGLTYQQGMHEIASHILYALEMDHQQHKGTAGISNVGGSHDTMAAQTYELLEAILSQMPACFDFQETIDSNEAPSFEKPLQASSRRVLQYLQRYDASLVQVLTNNTSGVPPQLYLTKWMRLLFSREVPTIQDALSVWDAIFLQTAACAITTNNKALQDTLEVAAVARLLSWRSQLYAKQSDELLAFIMNLPPQPNSDWLSWLPTLARREPLSLPPIVQVRPQYQQQYSQRKHQPQQLLQSKSSSASRFNLASIKSKLEEATQQAKETTQSLGQRLANEWDQVAVQFDDDHHNQTYQQRQQSAQYGQHRAENNAVSPSAPSYYNLNGRHEAAAGAAAIINTDLPHTPSGAVAAPRPPSSTSVLQEYLQQLERTTCVVPTHVWQALGKLQALERQQQAASSPQFR